MTTDRERIIQFLTEHPEWVDAYRTVYPGRWLRLQWNRHRDETGVWTLHDENPRNAYTNKEMFFTLPPEGEWRPLPEPETFEVEMKSHIDWSTGSTGKIGMYRDVIADKRFVGYKVRVTVEAIG